MTINQQDKTAAATRGGTVWYQLHSHREVVCEAMLQNFSHPRFEVVLPEDERRVFEQQLQARLRLIDDALDRLLNGTFGECVKCRRWIEDSKLHTDPSYPFCLGCERELEHRLTLPPYVAPARQTLRAS